MTSPSHQSGPFAIQHAFVVQFAGHAASDTEGLAGRIEHIVSGKAARFQSGESLLAFIMQMLEAYHSPDSGEPDYAINRMFAPHPTI